ncbi:MAG: alpha/beta fold hydrolase [Alcanivoracaceae bacterium]|nr:alpha/beta fold hydrolase [Alcanivoracaceae bacterium]
MMLPAQQAVVLVHGLWMSRWSFAFIAKHLSAQGYKVYKFGYATTSKPFAFNMLNLQAFVNSRSEETVHLVVHSMGGILSMRSLPNIRKTGKLIMLGSPVNGSQAAVAMSKNKWSSWLLKHAAEPLENGVVAPKVFRKSYMIAGISSYIGISRLVTKLPKPNDGTVALKETQADWINLHTTEKANHFSMLFRKNIQLKISTFLADNDKQQEDNNE